MLTDLSFIAYDDKEVSLVDFKHKIRITHSPETDQNKSEIILTSRFILGH